LRDDRLKNFLLVGAFRDENLELIQPFLDSMQDLQEAKAGADSPACFSELGVVADTPLENLGLDAVNGLLASVLSHSIERTQPLAELIHRKTAGNPYFVVQLLKQLQVQEILAYNFALHQWEWDVERAIAGTDVSDNVVDVIAARIQGVPSRVQRILQLAACLGFVVDANILRELDLDLCPRLVASRKDSEQEDAQSSGQSSGEDCRSSSPGHAKNSSPKSFAESHEVHLFDAALERAEQEGFIERTTSMVKFSHDLIHQGFYDMIGSTRRQDREMLHYEIGRFLKWNHECSEKSDGSDHQLLFLAVDQLNRGSSLIDSDDGRIALIELNYKACQVAKQQAGIEVISKFLHRAIELIQPSFWLYYYDLVLEVYNSSAEVDFSLGMLEEAKATIAAIMVSSIRARCCLVLLDWRQCIRGLVLFRCYLVLFSMSRTYEAPFSFLYITSEACCP